MKQQSTKTMKDCGGGGGAVSDIIDSFTRCLESGDPITRSVVTSVSLRSLSHEKEAHLTVKVYFHSLGGGELGNNGFKRASLFQSRHFCCLATIWSFHN